VQVDPIRPTLKLPGTKRLKLKHDEPLSNFYFKFNLRRYSKIRKYVSCEIEEERNDVVKKCFAHKSPGRGFMEGNYGGGLWRGLMEGVYVEG